MLDLTGVAPGATRQAMRVGRDVLGRPSRHGRRLVLPPLSQFLDVRLSGREGLRTRVQRGVSLCRFHNHRWLSRSVRHGALLGRTVAWCHVADAGIVAHALTSPGVRVRRRREAVGEPIVRCL